MIAVFGAIVGAAVGYNASQHRGSSRSSTAVAEADIESAAIAAQLATLAEIEFAPTAPTKRSGSVQMFSEGDIGVLPPLGVYDPLGLIETRDMRRYEIMEIKHGRAAMLGFLHIIAIHAGIRVPGYLSVSQDLKFSDVPAGCFASLEAVPTAGWLQIMVCRLGIQIRF